MTGWRIICDVGGTNIRIARSDGPKRFGELSLAQTAHCASLPQTLHDYWQQFADREHVLDVAICAAGPLDQGRITLTNSPLTVERESVSTALGGRPVVLFNDLEATAYAVPVLTQEDLQPVVAVSHPAPGPRLVVNVGTGFGAALLVQTASGWQSIATEAGHMTFSHLEPQAVTGRSATVALSVEECLSGLALGRDASKTFDQYTVSSAFGELFGAVCGNLVLATGAWGGVYLTGSVAAAWSRTRELSTFAAAFQSKGLMSERMKRVPVTEIVLPHPALVGLTTVGRC